MWGLCAYACSITFHLDIWLAVLPVCSVNSTCVSQHQELFSTNTSRLLQIRHGELQINPSRLWSLFRQHTATVCMFWSIFLRWTDNSEKRLKWKMLAWGLRVQNSPRATSPKVHISSITTSSVFAEMSQIWQVIIYNGSCRAEDRVLAQSPSITSVCVHPVMAQISKRMLVLALSWYKAYISSQLDSLLWALSKHVIDECLKLPVSPWTEDKWLCPLESLTI